MKYITVTDLSNLISYASLSIENRKALTFDVKTRLETIVAKRLYDAIESGNCDKEDEADYKRVMRLAKKLKEL